MKLLFDQNISHRVVLAILPEIPEARHVRDFNLQYSKDMEIWRFAKENGNSIVTFDSDFNNLATLFGHPPKIIWLRFGNTLTQELAKKLITRIDVIKSFLTDTAYADICSLEISD